jgi:hypothetical protein
MNLPNNAILKLSAYSITDASKPKILKTDPTILVNSK